MFRTAAVITVSMVAKELRYLYIHELWSWRREVVGSPASSLVK